VNLSVLLFQARTKWLIVFIISLFGCMTIMSCLKKGESAMENDFKAIIAETQAFADAWNNADAVAAASFYTEDGLRVGAFGDVQKGRDDIEAAYVRLLNETMPGATVKQDTGTVRMLTPDFAIWQGSIEIVPAGGLAPLKGYVVQVMKKSGNRWLIVESHPKFYPAQPNTD
jgi:uncharacterized protein (TIGR02246 family)